MMQINSSTFGMKPFGIKPYRRTMAALFGAATVVVGAYAVSAGAKDEAAVKSTANKPALTVNLTPPQTLDWPQTVAANGSIAPWQEAIIGAEVGGLRLTEVRVNVGDKVVKGQVLAQMASDTVAAERPEARAAAAEAEAMRAEAHANAERARQVQAINALSAQQITQLLTAEQAAQARFDAARARVASTELRLSKTRVLAPDSGVISARLATVGSLAQPGVELFRLIRGHRLEWRAELIANELGGIKSGMKAFVLTADGGRIPCTVRMVAPTVDPQTRIGLVYVDLPTGNTALRAGMYARGEFELGRKSALTVPQTAVLTRDGFSYVFRLDANNKVVQTKVSTARRRGDRIEIAQGLTPDQPVVGSGVGFLSDGDSVRVVDSAAAIAPAPVVKP